MRETLHHYSEGLRAILVRLINARYSLPTWLWTFASAAVGFIVFSYSVTKNPAIAEFSKALPLGGIVWGSALTIAGLSSMIGMAFHKYKFLQWGAMGSFVLWVFGTIAFHRNGGFANVVIFAAPMLLFWSYKYLASFVREFPRL